MNADHDLSQQKKPLPGHQTAAETGPPSTANEMATLGPALQIAPLETTGAKRYFGDYELLDEIARGGMGVVYKARQISLNRIVALKMILSGQLASNHDIQRFYAEAEAAANLNHPGIVPIHEIGQIEGQHFFSMSFIDGGSLADRIRSGPLRPEEAAAYMRKIAEAIHYAHEHDVIHRDLKPGNVLLDNQGEPKVTDFGLAKRVKGDSQLTATGQILGTPSYMPPEQAAGKIDDVGPRADIYSLGAVLYCLLTGRPPFQAASPMDTLMQVIEQEPLPPRQLNPQVPLDLDTICLKCLEKDPSRRYQSARELMEELERFELGEPIQARPVSRWERACRWTGRNPFLAGLSAAVLLLVATLAIGGPLAALQQRSLRFAAEEAQRQRARAQVDALLSASPSAVPVLIEGLKLVYDDVLPQLKHLDASPQLTDAERLRVSLALLKHDPTQINYLRQKILISSPDEFLLIRQFLYPYREQLIESLWTEARDPDLGAQTRFRAACALALFDPDSQHWDDIAAQVTEVLVNENSLVAGEWMKALQPVRRRLMTSIRRAALNRASEFAPQRLLAANIAANYAADNPQVLAELAWQSDAQEFAVLLEPLSAHRDTALAACRNVLQTAAADLTSGELTDSTAEQAANAAIGMLHLQDDSSVWPLLAHSADPRLRSYLIHRFARFNVPAAMLIQRLEVETDPGIQQGILLALGNYRPESLSHVDASAISRIVSSLRNAAPSSAVHSAVEWLAKQLAIEAETQLPPTPPATGSRQWYVNSEGLTFAIMQPSDFVMGSPEDELGRRADESQFRCRIEQPYAISTTEVAVAQFQRFLAANPTICHSYSTQYSPEPACPQTSITWYEAAAYCNWLSQQEHIPPAEWCFLPNADGNYAAGMQLAENYLQRLGYRLPTEAEWEYACRGNTVTARHYGQSESLLDEYAWYLANSNDHSWNVGTKKPNQFGLFDMHGNVWEWCVDVPFEYPAQPAELVVDRVRDSGAMQNGQPRALRGGSYFYHHIYTRSALRNREPVDARYYGIGMRPVRTWSAATR